MMIWKLILESIVFAYRALVVNKLRAFLSLLGVTIGIFAIISVLTMVDTLEKGVRDSFKSISQDAIFIQKWPWSMEGNYPWWKYYQRPVPTYQEMKELRERKMASAEEFTFIISDNKKVSYKSQSLTDVDIEAVSDGYAKVKTVQIAKGRFMNDLEIAAGRHVAVIGATVAEALFGTNDCIGKEIKISGFQCSVIGVYEKVGAGFFGESADEIVTVPLQFGSNFIAYRGESGYILAKAAAGVSKEQLKEELKGKMRSVRRLSPKQDDNFALNEVSMLNRFLDGFFGVVNIAGFVIGGFSIIVGGFSIANIMFVSVKERTNLIGIQKSLGAKNNFILLQFLFESTFLCLVGGILGLLLIFICTAIASLLLDMNVLLSIKNIQVGMGLSAIIGLVSGVIPAYSASQLDPVEAIRSA